MPSTMTEQELQTAVREVIKRSLLDSAFRTKALADGGAAIAAVSSKALPAGISLTFIENRGKQKKTVVLPDPVAEPDQLSEADLEQVAGGCGVTCGSSSCVIT